MINFDKFNNKNCNIFGHFIILEVYTPFLENYLIMPLNKETKTITSNPFGESFYPLTYKHLACFISLLKNCMLYYDLGFVYLILGN